MEDTPNVPPARSIPAPAPGTPIGNVIAPGTTPGAPENDDARRKFLASLDPSAPNIQTVGSGNPATPAVPAQAGGQVAPGFQLTLPPKPPLPEGVQMTRLVMLPGLDAKGNVVMHSQAPTDPDDITAIREYGTLMHNLPLAARQWVGAKNQAMAVERQAAQGREAADTRRNEYLTPEEAASVGVTYGTTRAQAAAMGLVPKTSAQRTKSDALGAVAGMIRNIEKEVDGMTSPTTPIGRLLATPGRVMDVYGQADPKLAALHSRLQGTQALLLRAMGEVGTFTDKDNERAKALNIIVAPIPDTEAVMREKIKGLKDLLFEMSARPGPTTTPSGGGSNQVSPSVTPSGTTEKWVRGPDGKLKRQ